MTLPRPLSPDEILLRPARTHGWRRRVGLPSLRLSISERRLLLCLGDLAVIEGALLLALVAHFGLETLPQHALRSLTWFLTLAVVWCAWAVFFDVYNLARAANSWNSARAAASAAVLAVFTYALVPWLTPAFGAREPLFLFLAASALGMAGWRSFYSLLFRQPWFKQRVLIVGAGHAGRSLVAALRTEPEAGDTANPFREAGCQITGLIDDNPALRDRAVAGIAVVGGRNDLPRLAHSLAIDEIVLAITHRHTIDVALFDAILRCREMGIRFSTMPVFYERLLGRVPVEHIGQDLHLVMPMHETAGDRLSRGAKRAADVLGALVGLVLLAMLIPPLLVANRLTSPGPLFYRQTRIGRGGKPFICLKFRSMSPDAEKETGAVWATKDDQRVTPVGRILRSTRLDELPQCVNVLAGEMSLIGPRPERPEFVEALAQTLPFYRARHAVRPGITGWAQVRHPYANTHEDARIKLEYDLFYVAHVNLWLDMSIMVKTLAEIVKFRGI
ncbi:MAG: sugar transferase [Caldilineales bacterium]|nr:sugar transferase [Caldilineales bacterium]